MTTTRYAAALLLLAVTSNVSAEGGKLDAAPPGRARPPKELEAFMKPLEGSWNCDGKLAAGAFGSGLPEIHSKESIEFKKKYDGFFYRGEIETKKAQGGTMPAEMPSKGEVVLGWDAHAKQVLVWHFNGNGTASFSTGRPQGNTLVTVGDLDNHTKMRETHIVKSAREHFHKFEIDEGKGWMPLIEHHCTK